MAASGKTIEQDFLRKLKEFAARGYAFESGHSLRKGTRQDRDAKGTQREAFDAYIEGFSEDHRHGYFEIPTGVGKTALFIALVKNYFDAADGKRNVPRSLIVVPSEKLAVQTAQALAKFLPELAPTIETDDDQGREIDWENSHVGLQYSKMKHADRKPRVLITTYQSLNGDREDKVYPPDEYGLVIYDEGHALTAGQYGMAVDKFSKSIQLAVSATPEYSEEKTVSARLPHRYYGISIGDAVNRGDLCNPRPVLLKTNYTVDKAKFKKYVEQRKGAPLTDAQLTSLLNEQTRNRAAMEAYLLGADPDSGERYLGQNGMIFCGSTDHVDDFTRQFDDLIDKPKYRPVRQWLKEEGVELIAPVHGKIKGAWLKKGLLANGNGKVITEGRKYEGNKEWYSEAEIFDLHAKGKILLLASVKKLKEGYDSPRDSIIIDTVDRLSKVDATQIVGRGFRLNPPNAEYNDPGNPDKTCTVINMVDRNTHELYADKPQMLPIYCAEIIEGVEFRKPMRRKHLTQRFSKHPPEINATLEDSGFKLETDIERVREISKKNKGNRENLDGPYLPESKKYWILAGRLHGCMAVKVDTLPQNAKLLMHTCTKLLDEQPNRRWELPADKRLNLKAGSYKTSEVINLYKSISYDKPVPYFDPRMALFIRKEMGLPNLLPDDKKHWIPASTNGCSKIGVERSKLHTVALYRICERLSRLDKIGGMSTDEVIGKFTNKGQDEIYYFDPRLLKKNLITKDMVKEEAKKILASGDKSLLKIKPPSRQKSFAKELLENEIHRSPERDR